MKEKIISLDTRSVLAILQGKKTQLRLLDVPPYEYLRPSKQAKQRQDTLSGFRVREGDHLRVREAWTPLCFNGEKGHVFICYQSDYTVAGPFPFDPVDKVRLQGWSQKNRFGHSQFYDPSYLPRNASRLVLKVERVRHGLLQDISREDLRSEGFLCSNPDLDQGLFQLWWDQHHHDLYDWMSNPLVWVIDFQTLPK